MPKKTYYKPNRSVPRYFKPCDVARAAYNCHTDTGNDRIEIIRCVVKGLGFEYVALPGADRELPEVINSKIDTILTLAGKLQSSVAVVRRVLLELDKSLSFILKFVPDFITDDEKTVEDKLFNKVLSGAKKVSKRAVGYLKLLDDLRDIVEEWEQDLKAFILNVGEAARIVKTAKELYSAKIYFSEEQIINCKCKRPRGVFTFTVEANLLGKDSVYLRFQLTNGEAGSFVEGKGFFVAEAGAGDSADEWQVDSDVFALVRADDINQIAIQAFRTGTFSYQREL